jgi:hypothetical protein
MKAKSNHKFCLACFDGSKGGKEMEKNDQVKTGFKTLFKANWIQFNPYLSR